MSASSCSSATAVTVTGSCGRAAGAGRLYAPAAVAGHFWRSPSTLAMGCSGGSPLARKMVLFGSLVFVGLTAGAAYVVWFDYDPSGMSPAFYAETMQHAIRVLTVPLPAIVVLGLIFTVLATFQARNDRQHSNQQSDTDLEYRVSTCKLGADRREMVAIPDCAARTPDLRVVSRELRRAHPHVRKRIAPGIGSGSTQFVAPTGTRGCGLRPADCRKARAKTRARIDEGQPDHPP